MNSITVKKIEMSQKVEMGFLIIYIKKKRILILKIENMPIVLGDTI